MSVPTGNPVGRPPVYDEPRTGFALRLPASLHERLKAQSERRDLSMNLLITKAVERFVDELERS